MPNWKVHLEVAKNLNKNLEYSGEELEEFNLGNILPDINNCYIVTDISKKLDHKYTHFQDEIEIPSYINYKNIYGEKIYKKPLMLGFYTHLFTDYTWNNFFYTNYDNNEKLQGLSHVEKRKIKQEDFKTYNDLFIENKPQFIHLHELVEKTKEIDRVSITEDDIKKVEKFLKDQKKSNNKFQILSKEILDKMMNETIKNLENEIKEFII